MNAKRFFLTALSLLLILATLFPLASCGVTETAATEAVTTAEPATAEITNPESIAAETTAEPAKYTVVLNAPSTTAIHTAMQAQYLAESDPDTASSYAAGLEELGRPNPIILTWDVETELAESDIRAFTLRIWRKSAPRQTVSKVLAKSVRAYSFVNAMVGETYCWTVTATDGDGATYPSEVATFTTEDQAPRNLTVDGVTNVRDLGGWKTQDGGRIRQGLLYRGGQLSINFGTEAVVTQAGITTLKNELGIKGEIDLRESKAAGDRNENGGLTASVLGAGVSYYNRSMLYDDSLGERSLAQIPAIFAVLADENNYPLYFHCRIGTDRTGLIAWLVLALCGVSETDLWRDYLFSNFGVIESSRTMSRIKNAYVKDIKNTQGDSFADKTYNYLKNTLHVKEADLKAVIRIMKEPAK